MINVPDCHTQTITMAASIKNEITIIVLYLWPNFCMIKNTINSRPVYVSKNKHCSLGLLGLEYLYIQVRYANLQQHCGAFR